jgi:phosphomannomutase/phosphoglucomutase
MVYFYAWKNKVYGVVITASHNPKEWNGLKIVKPNGVSFINELKKLEKIFQSKNFIRGKGKITKDNAKKLYEKFLIRRFNRINKKIVAEFFGGVSSVALSIFRKMGLKTITLHARMNKNFSGFRRPEPKGKNLIPLKKKVKKMKADFGVAFDGDGDRSVFIDDKGRELNGSILSAIFVNYILRKKRGKIIVTADCASEIEDIVKKLNGKIIWWRVGHGFIEKKCLEEKALFAGEQSSHFYFNEFYPFSDGILATIYLAKILSESNKKLSDLVGEMNLCPMEKLYINVRTDKNKIKILEKLRKKYPRALDVMDGIRIRLNKKEWVLIRASQTMPEINLCIEAKNKKRLKVLVRKYTKMIKNTLSQS